MNPEPEVLALCRFSTAEQVELGRAGVEGQRRINQLAAQSHGVRIRKEYVVVDVSGRHVAHDPQFQEIFAALKDPTLAGVLVPEQSRIVRPLNFEDWQVLGHFQRNKKKIYTPTGVIDPNTPEGRMALTVGGLMSGEELHNLLARFARGKMIGRIEGRHPEGNHMLPRGFKFIRERNAEGKITGWHWEQDPVEMVRMQRGFELLFAGEPYEVITEKIGGGWTGSGWKRAAQNPIWIGIRRYALEATGDEYTPDPTPKHPNPKPRHRKVLRKTMITLPDGTEAEIPAPIDVPTLEDLKAGARPVVKPIMSIEQWEAAQEIIKAREGIVRKTKVKNLDRPRFLGMGIVICACGELMYPKYGSDGRSHLDAYKCKSRYPNPKNPHYGPGCGRPPIHRIDLDAGIDQLISHHLWNAAFLLKVLETATAQDPVPDPLRIRIEQARANLAAGRKDLLDMVRHHEITRKEFQEQIALLETEVRQNEALMPPAPPAIDVKAFLQRISDTFALFDRLPFLKKREILKGAVKAIVTDSIAGTITSITISGGYLGRANGSQPSTGTLAIRPTPDIVIPIPQPFEIPAIYVDGRDDNGQHPNQIATQFRRRIQ